MLKVCGVNSVLREGTTVTGITTASTDTPASDVLTDDLSRFWRAGTEPSLAFRNTGNRYKKADCVYIADHNLDSFALSGTEGAVTSIDSWRIICDSGILSLYQAPTSIQEQTNFTGTGVFTERSAFSVPLAYLVPTNPAVLSRFRVRFISPKAGVTLAATQIFRFRAVTLGAGNCTYTVRLKEGGVLRATLASGTLTHPFDSVLGGTWSASSLVSTGVPELEVEITPGTTSAKVSSATWHPLIASSTSPNYYNSGLIPISLPTNYREIDHTVLTDVHFFPNGPLEVGSLYLEFFRTGEHAGVFDGLPVQVGRVDCGKASEFDVKRDSYRIRPVDPSIAVEMRGGNYRYHKRRKYLEAEVATLPTPIATALASMYEGIERQVGMTEALLWLFDSENVRGGYLPVFGTLKGLGEYGNIQRFFEHGFSVKQAR